MGARWLGLLARVSLLTACGLFLIQGCLIYHPRAYGPGEPTLRQGAVALPYDLPEGRQVAQYVAPRTKASGPEASGIVWLVFGGNAALAWDYAEELLPVPAEHVGFLFVDYPGYGANAGQPNPESLLAAAEAAVAAAAQAEGVSADKLRVAVFGHSLGCAAALQYAAQHPVASAVLCSPFTSLIDMARRVVGWPLCYLLRHRYDNDARLNEALERTHGPVLIVHGEEDEVIPCDMGRALARAHPDRIKLRTVPAYHNDVVVVARSIVRDAIAAVR